MTGPCAKQTVTATIIAADGRRFVGTNFVRNPQPTCPRGDLPTGVGYEMCREICDQFGHAEINAIAAAGVAACGGVLYLEGHTYACDPCKAAAWLAGIRMIVIGAPKPSEEYNLATCWRGHEVAVNFRTIPLGCPRCALEVRNPPPPPSPTGSGDFSIGGALWPGLSKLIEECGEAAELLPELILAKTIAALQVTSGKLIGSEGRVDHWSGDLRKRFVEEIGDLRAAITFFVHHNLLDDFPAMEDRTDAKVALFEQWHRDGLAGRRLDTLPGAPK